jgi:hypothetical protein
MSDEQEHDNLTTNARVRWRLGGPLSPEQRKEAKELFLAYLKTDHNVTFACEQANISREAAYTWKEKDQTFAKGWENAIERVKDIARSSIYRRGILGWDEKVASQGQVVMEYEPVVDDEGNQCFNERGRPLVKGGKPLMIHKWSDPLALAYAKANLPEYKEKPQVNINTQLADLAEQAKNDLLADLSASISHEDQDQAH